MSGQRLFFVWDFFPVIKDSPASKQRFEGKFPFSGNPLRWLGTSQTGVYLSAIYTLIKIPSSGASS